MTLLETAIENTNTLDGVACIIGTNIDDDLTTVANGMTTVIAVDQASTASDSDNIVRHNVEANDFFRVVGFDGVELPDSTRTQNYSLVVLNNPTRTHWIFFADRIVSGGGLIINGFDNLPENIESDMNYRGFSITMTNDDTKYYTKA